MIRFLKFHIAVLLGVIALCSGCSAPEPPPPTPPENDVPWVYEPDAVVLRISADERLNEHEGEPSSLMLCVYELATREGVDKRLASPEGFAELLACGDGAFINDEESLTLTAVTPLRALVIDLPV